MDVRDSSGWIGRLAVVIAAAMISRVLAVVLAVGFVVWEYVLPHGLRQLRTRRASAVRHRAGAARMP